MLPGEHEANRCSNKWLYLLFLLALAHHASQNLPAAWLRRLEEQVAQWQSGSGLVNDNVL